MKLWLCMTVACAALAFPAGAAAIKCAPPGNAGVDQYFETVPGSSCNQPSNGPGSGPGNGSQGSLPPGTRNQLSAQGPVGQAVAGLVSSNGTGSRSGRRSGANRGSGTGAALSASGSGPLSALLDPVLSGSSSGGVGVLLPIFLGVALLLVLLAVLARRILRSSGPEA